LLALNGLTLVFKHPYPVMTRQVMSFGEAGNSNWPKDAILIGSSAKVEWYTDGYGPEWPQRRWGARVMIQPLDAPKPSADNVDRAFEQYERATKKANGSRKPLEIERDCWDEVRLRAPAPGVPRRPGPRSA